MINFFEPLQESILHFRVKLENENIVIDKTNQMFLDLNLNLLEFVGTHNPQELDTLFEYSARTMGNEFTKVIQMQSIGEKAQAVLLMFFLRLANENKVRPTPIQNPHLDALYEIMNKGGYKYPPYIQSQRDFANEQVGEKVKRMEFLK